MTEQEQRTERVSMAVTPFEKKALKGVAAARDTDESNILREMSLDAVVAEFASIRALVAGEAA